MRESKSGKSFLERWSATLDTLAGIGLMATLLYIICWVMTSLGPIMKYQERLEKLSMEQRVLKVKLLVAEIKSADQILENLEKTLGPHEAWLAPDVTPDAILPIVERDFSSAMAKLKKLRCVVAAAQKVVYSNPTKDITVGSLRDSVRSYLVSREKEIDREVSDQLRTLENSFVVVNSTRTSEQLKALGY